MTDLDNDRIFQYACEIQSRGDFLGEMDVFDIFEVLRKTAEEKIERDTFTDSKIEYNDEIVSITPVGELETIDISVTGDNLFVCNDILTKNSMGLVMTLDVLFALIRTDELDDQNSIMIKQLKNRYSDPAMDKKFLLGLNRPQMTFYDLEDSAQQMILPEAKDKVLPLRKQPDEPLFDVSKRDRSSLNASDFKF